MSLLMFQRALVELTLTPQKARALRLGDESILAGFELTSLERDRLEAVVHQRGMSVSCSLSRGNRLEMIFQSFPMTCVLLKPVLRELVDELWIDIQPTNYQLAGEDAVFAALLTRKLAESNLSIPYLEEIFAYELACMELTRQARDLARNQTDTGAELIVDFQHSPDDLLPPLSQLTAPPAGLPEGNYRARVRLIEDLFKVELVDARTSTRAPSLQVDIS
jgi:hypothetical protein